MVVGGAGAQPPAAAGGVPAAAAGRVRGGPALPAARRAAHQGLAGRLLAFL